MNLPMDPKGFAEHLSKNTLRETVRMGVDAAQGKTHDGRSIFRNIASGTLQGLAANQIGGMYAPDNPERISFVTHKILHGLSGAGAGFILNPTQEGAVSGAIGAVVGESIADAMQTIQKDKIAEKVAIRAENTKDLDQANLNAIIQDETKSILNVSKVSSAVVTALANQNVNVGIQTATVAVENNMLRLIEEGVCVFLAKKAAQDAKTWVQVGKVTKNIVQSTSKTGGPNLDPGQDPEDPNKDREETKGGEKKQDNKTVYQSMNKETKETDYVGITNNLERRYAEHSKTKGIRIEPIDGLEKLPALDAKAVEQTLIEFHQLGKNGGSLLNKINSVATSNPTYASALKRGMELLKNVKYEGF